MNMKKISALVLALAMAMSLCVSASAAELKMNRNTVSQVPDSSTTIDVTGKYVNKAAKTYSVDITWGSMEFTYTIADDATWNPETHEYNAGASGAVGAWSCESGADKLTVTNNSNAPVKVNIAANPLEPSPGAYGNVSIDFSGITSGTTLKSADGNSDGLTAEGTVKLSGALSNALTEKTNLFTITVSLEAVN